MAALLGVGGQAAADCQLKRIPLKLQLEGRAVVLPAKINGRDVRLQLSIGSFFSMLSRDAASRLQLRERPSPVEVNVRGGSLEAFVTNADTFDLSSTGGDIHFRHVDFLVGGNGFGDGIDGELGQNVFAFTDMEFDLANSAVSMLRAHGCSDGNLAYWAKPGEAIARFHIEHTDTMHSQFIGTGKLDGHSLRFMISNAGSSWVSTRVAKSVGISRSDAGVTDGGTIQGISGKSTPTWIARFKEVDLGGEVIKNPRIRVGDLDYLDVDMILGADFLVSHHLYVSRSQHEVYFTYNGGTVFDVGDCNCANKVVAVPATDKSAGVADPKTAEEFAQNGRAAVARRDYQGAIDNFSRAIELAPQDAANYMLRGQTYWQRGNAVLAMADMDKAIALKPDDARVHQRRGQLHLAYGDEAGAAADFSEAERLAPADNDLSLDIAVGYSNTGHYAIALTRLDRWIDAHQKDERLAQALNSRCLARAAAKLELDRALEDCNGAVRRDSNNPHYLDSRALVYLHLGQFDKSMADYRHAMDLQPRNGIYRYGLGLAERGAGQTAAADEDMKAGTALWSGVVKYYERMGVKP